LTDNARNTILLYLDKQVGSHYDWILLGLEGIRYIFHFMPFYKEPFYSHICSTLVSDAYKKAGINLCPGIIYPSPKDLSQSKLLRKIKSI
jgi:hypothetical protein